MLRISSDVNRSATFWRKKARQRFPARKFQEKALRHVNASVKREARNLRKKLDRVNQALIINLLDMNQPDKCEVTKQQVKWLLSRNYHKTLRTTAS